MAMFCQKLNKSQLQLHKFSEMIFIEYGNTININLLQYKE